MPYLSVVVVEVNEDPSLYAFGSQPEAGIVFQHGLYAAVTRQGAPPT
ncbi:MAG: hypothetical protein HOQ07_07005 [Sinomonas sp.]|nr:hypothetical protein [Sinomonas sp.]